MKDSPSQNSIRLLAEFPVPGLPQWHAEVERLLKGVPFAKAMLTRTLEGITLEPMPTAKDTAGLPWLDTMPGQSPFIRGARADGYHQVPWLVAQEIPLPGVGEFNAALQHDLARGQTAINLVLDAAGQMGRDPVNAPAGTVGLFGTSLADLQDLKTAFAGVDLATTPVMIEAGAAALPVAAMLAALWDETGVDPARVSGCLGCDPLFGLAREGTLPVPAEVLYDQLAELTRWASCAPGLRTLPVHETPWHEGGADHALSLGLTIAGGIGVLRQMEQRGISPAEAVPRIHFHVTVDTDFFMSLAKLRALRLLWSRIQVAAGMEPVPAYIHASSSRRMLTALEVYPNLLRTTTAAMAAVLGGVDSLHTARFDEIDHLPEEFGRRIARNVPLILAHEVHLDHVTDPAGGAWYPEKLTADLAAAAWEQVQAVEIAGGMIPALENGLVQKMISNAAVDRRQILATGKKAMVGVNRDADTETRLPKPRGVDTAKLSATRKGELEARKTWQNSPQTGFAGMMAAVKAGARISDLVNTQANGLEVDPIPLRRDAEPFEMIRRRVLASGERSATRVYCACLGDPARYMPRLEFVRGFFQCGGFQVISEGFTGTALEAVEQADKAGAATVVLVGLDETYAEYAAQTARLLTDLDPPPRVVLAGKPGSFEDELRASGVSEFLHVRSDMLDVLGRLAADPEVAP